QFETSLLLRQLSLAESHRRSLTHPMPVEAAFEPFAEVKQALPLGLEVLLAVGQLSARLGQIIHDLGHTLLIARPNLLQRRVGFASLITKADEPLAFLLQVRGQLLFLKLQGVPAPLETNLLLGEGRLLRCDSCGLDPQGLLLLLQSVLAGRES